LNITNSLKIGGLHCRTEIAVPFATEPYGEAGERQIADSRLEEASETDAQRLRDIANEAPVIRLPWPGVALPQ